MTKEISRSIATEYKFEKVGVVSFSLLVLRKTAIVKCKKI